MNAEKTFLRLSIILTLSAIFILLISCSVFAESFYEDLNEFMKNRKPTSQEEYAQTVLPIPIEIKGKNKQSLVVIPLYTAQVFEQQLFAQRKFEKLKEFCNVVLKIHPDSFTYSRLAQAFEVNGDIKDAVDAYNEEIKIAPGEPMPYFMLWGIYSFDKQDNEQAEGYLAKFNAIFLKMEEAEADSVRISLQKDLMDLGSYFLDEQYNFEYAKKYFSMIRRINPDHERAQLNLIICDLNQGVKVDDSAAFDRAVADLKVFAETAQDQEVASFARQVIDNL